MRYPWLNVGQWTIDLLAGIARMLSFSVKVFLAFPRRWIHARIMVNQLYVLCILSLGIVLISGLFIGMVVSIQGYNTLKGFGAEAQLGQLVALSVFRELGPVVTALLFAGRAGSSLSAELGLMQVTEQIDSMEMMAVDPFSRILFPRLLAGILSMPILALFFSLFSIWGATWVSTAWLGIDYGMFISNLKSSVDFSADILSGLFKSFIFGFIISLIAIYQGYCAERSSAGIAMASTRTVVYASVLVLFFDLLITTMMEGG